MSDKTATQIVREGVRRACADLTEQLTEMGFERNNKKVWCRRREHSADFVHVSRDGSTYGAPLNCAVSLRLHCGVRVLNSERDFLALNGPWSDATRTREGRYHLRFDAKSWSTYERCIEDLVRFVRKHGEPMFRAHADLSWALESQDSLLDDEARAALRESLAGNASPERVALSEKVLGFRARPKRAR